MVRMAMEPGYKQDYDPDRDRSRIKVETDPGQKQDGDRDENMTEAGLGLERFRGGNRMWTVIGLENK